MEKPSIFHLYHLLSDIHDRSISANLFFMIDPLNHDIHDRSIRFFINPSEKTSFSPKRLAEEFLDLVEAVCRGGPGGVTALFWQSQDDLL